MNDTIINLLGIVLIVAVFGFLAWKIFPKAKPRIAALPAEIKEAAADVKGEIAEKFGSEATVLETAPAPVEAPKASTRKTVRKAKTVRKSKRY